MLGRMARDYSEFGPDLPSTNSKLIGLEKAWVAFKNQGLLPSRSHFDARTLKPWLPHVALIDVVGEAPRFRIHLMGTAVVRCAGGDFTGKWIDECVSESDRANVLQPFADCLNSRAQVWSNKIYLVSGHFRMLVHRVYLPCASDGQTIDGFVVGIFALEERGHYYGRAQIRVSAEQKTSHADDGGDTA